jgi:misacylated tRNA(Ala) deacylase
MTSGLFLHDAYLRDFTAVVVDVRDRAVVLDRTAFYPTGGGQPHDTGRLDEAAVVDVRKADDVIWHTVEGLVPAVGSTVQGEIDWERRYALMRTHTALHVLCGVIWNAYRVPVTGGNMEPLSARMDFEFDPLPTGFGAEVERLVNAELAADRPIEVSFLPRWPRLGSWTSWDSTSRPTAARTCVARVRSGTCGWSRQSPRAKATSASASR